MQWYSQSMDKNCIVSFQKQNLLLIWMCPCVCVYWEDTHYVHKCVWVRCFCYCYLCVFIELISSDSECKESCSRTETTNFIRMKSWMIRNNRKNMKTIAFRMKRQKRQGGRAQQTSYGCYLPKEILFSIDIDVEHEWISSDCEWGWVNQIGPVLPFNHLLCALCTHTHTHTPTKAPRKIKTFMFSTEIHIVHHFLE